MRAFITASHFLARAGIVPPTTTPQQDQPLPTARPLWLILAVSMCGVFPGAGAAAEPRAKAGASEARASEARTSEARAKADGSAASQDDDDNDDDDDGDSAPGAPPDSWPTTYVDLETGWSSTPGNTIGLGRNNLRFLTGEKSRGFYMSAPLTIELSDRLTVFAGLDGSGSQTPGDKWSKFTPASWSVGGSAEVIEQSGLMPGVTLSASASRPFEPIALGVFSTTWTGGIDLDLAFDADQTRGLTAGVSYSRTQVSSSFARVGAQLGGYIGGYWSPSKLVNLSAQVGVQYFGGAEAASLLRLKPVTTPYVLVELEHVDDDDNRVFAMNLGLGWSPKPVVQFTISTPLYLAR